MTSPSLLFPEVCSASFLPQLPQILSTCWEHATLNFAKQVSLLQDLCRLPSRLPFTSKLLQHDLELFSKLTQTQIIFLEIPSKPPLLHLQKKKYVGLPVLWLSLLSRHPSLPLLTPTLRSSLQTHLSSLLTNSLDGSSFTNSQLVK